MSPRACSPEQAVSALPDGALVVSVGSSGEPTTLLRALAALSPGRDWTLASGLLFGDYVFGDAVSAGALRYRTWHVTRPVRDLVATGAAEYVPVRASAVAQMLRQWPVGAALVRVSPPDRVGRCSLGGSASYAAVAVAQADVVIAEIDCAVPRTRGNSTVPYDCFTAVTESSEPAPAYRAARTSPVGERITERVLALLPPEPTLQVGIGEVPESLVRALAGGSSAGPLRFVGMATDDIVDLDRAGLLAGDGRSGPPSVLSPELHGGQRLLRWADDNPRLEMHPSSVAHDAAALGAIARFVSVNSALQVSLGGDVNSEMADGLQVSGTGGSLDYVESAWRSPGGFSVIALASTTPAGRSRLVPRVESVSLPRSMVDVVVTEHGIARLSGKSARERAAALIAIADPAHRDELARASGVGERAVSG